MAIVNGYCLLAELKSWMGDIGVGDTVDDTKMELAVEATSRGIDQVTQRHYWQTSAGTARVFAPCDSYTLNFGPFNDLVSASAVKTDDNSDGTFETTWSASDYQLHPVNPAAAPETKPYLAMWAVGTRCFPRSVNRRRHLVEVTGVWGWAAVPNAVKQACLIVAAELVKLKDAPFGVAGFAEYGAVRVRQNPIAMAMLAPYVHPEAAVLVA